MAPKMRQVVIWTNADSIHWRIYATLEGDEFMTGVWVAVGMSQYSDRIQCYILQIPIFPAIF